MKKKYNWKLMARKGRGEYEWNSGEDRSGTKSCVYKLKHWETPSNFRDNLILEISRILVTQFSNLKNFKKERNFVFFACFWLLQIKGSSEEGGFSVGLGLRGPV